MATPTILLNGAFALFLILILWEFFLGLVFGTLQLSGVLGPLGAGADVAVSSVDTVLYALLLGVRLLVRPRFLDGYRRATLLFLSAQIRAVLGLVIIVAWVFTFGISAATDGSDCRGESFEMDCVIAFVIHRAYLLLYAASFAPIAFAGFLVVQLGWNLSSKDAKEPNDRGFDDKNRALRRPERIDGPSTNPGPPRIHPQPKNTPAQGAGNLLPRYHHGNQKQQQRK